MTDRKKRVCKCILELYGLELQQHLSTWKYETIVEAEFNNTEDGIGEKLRQRKKLELGAKKAEVSQ